MNRLERVDDAARLLVIKYIDISTSSKVIARDVWPTATDIAAAQRALCHVTFPPFCTMIAVNDVGFELEPPRLGGRAVHVDVQQPEMFTVPSVTTIT